MTQPAMRVPAEMTTAMSERTLPDRCRAARARASSEMPIGAAGEDALRERRQVPEHAGSDGGDACDGQHDRDAGDPIAVVRVTLAVCGIREAPGGG